MSPDGVPRSRFPERRGNFGDSRTFKADIGLLNLYLYLRRGWPLKPSSAEAVKDYLTFAWVFRGFVGQNRGRGDAILTPDKLVLTFGGSYVCTNFGENRSRNATLRVPTDGQIHTLTD